MHSVQRPVVAVSQRAELAAVLRVLTPVLDIIDTPVEAPVPPAWCAERGWTEFLLELDDAALFASERGGFAALLAETPQAPAALRELAWQARPCVALPTLGSRELALPLP